ncbi:hypothetical protein [Streptomyces aidingensis]|uniref:Uncharacterized protein n=1 Tax=Streptomyces aidingensis TaxID=910347 RepID=A0A1I1GT13_9ACTN|nr:hypothetical protein [Streptomyces aidingensis]SFC12363.1 hypothetical protein SAMN05421773_10243 [Streptomyces aidingensis]
MTTPEQQSADDEIEDAEAVCDELEDVLTVLGIKLPSLCVDIGPSAPFVACPPLVELGRCNVETARALAAALRGSAAVEVTR